jgi:hypothetical protein
MFPIHLHTSGRIRPDRRHLPTCSEIRMRIKRAARAV